jgi:hypothetical protein
MVDPMENDDQLVDDDFRNLIISIADKFAYLAGEVSGSKGFVDIFGEHAEKIYDYMDIFDAQLEIACKATKIGLTKTVIKKIRDFIKKG